MKDEAQGHACTVRAIMRRVRRDGFWNVLMVHNTERGKKPAGWGLPGGGVELGEDLAVAAARELSEETGLTILPEDLVEIDCSLARGSTTHWNYTFEAPDYDSAMGEITIENDREKTVDMVEWIPCEDIMEAYASVRQEGQPVDLQGRRYYRNHLLVICGED